MSRISLYPTSWNGHPSSMDGLFYGIFNLSSYIAQQFFQFLEDLLFGSFHGLSDYLGVDSPEEYPMPVRRSSSESVIQCFSSSNSLEGFKPQGNCGRSSFDKKDLRVKPRRFVIIEHNSCFTQLISRVLLLQKCSLRCFCQIASAPWRCIVIYARFATARAASLLWRIRKTFRGSSGDIGWLQRAPGMAPVVDGTPRFLELLQGVRDGKHTLPDLFVYLLVPGLFSNHSPLYFVSTKRSFSKMGLACHIAKIHSEASVEHNAWELKQYVEELYWGSGKPVMLLGHSKGGVDAAAALSLYWSSLKDKVAGLALVQSPYGGTPVASDILRQGQIADKETRKVAEFLVCKMIKGDIRSLEDLTYDKRREFVLKHKLPDQIPIIAFHSEASIAPGVLATMSQIAHAELPWLPLPRFCGASEPSDDCVRVGRKVPVVIPLAAVMAIYAVHLRLRYGEKSDGMVTCRDAEVPGSVVIRPDRKLDHAWMVYSSWKKNSGEPDCVDMCEAILSLLVEMGSEKLGAGIRG